MSENNSTSVKDIVLANFNKDVENVASKLFRDDVIENVGGRIPESIFKEYFLPHFANTVENPDEGWRNKWITISGSPSAEVAVFNDALTERLFTVPPMVDTTRLLMMDQGLSIGHIIKKAELLSNNLPQQGAKYQINELMRKGDEFQEAAREAGIDPRWLEILERYGYLEGAKGSEASTEVEDDLEDMLDFGD